MLSLTQTTGYAVKALGCLSRAGESRQTADIAKVAGVPKPYLSKIIQSLARGGLVVAKRGIGGGITLACPPEEISLLQIVEAVEGQGWLGDCLLGFDECTSMTTCPTHDFWQRIRREITQELRRTSLASVIAFKAECQGGVKQKEQKVKPPARASGGPGATRTGGKGRKTIVALPTDPRGAVRRPVT